MSMRGNIGSTGYRTIALDMLLIMEHTTPLYFSNVNFPVSANSPIDTS